MIVSRILCGLCIGGALTAQAAPTDRISNLVRQPIYFEPVSAGTFAAAGDGLRLEVSPASTALWIQPRGAGAAKIDLRLLGGIAPRQLVGGGLQSGVTNYYEGTDPLRWRKSIPHFSSVRANGVYPGIDFSSVRV